MEMEAMNTSHQNTQNHEEDVFTNLDETRLQAITRLAYLLGFQEKGNKSSSSQILIQSPSTVKSPIRVAGQDSAKQIIERKLKSEGKTSSGKQTLINDLGKILFKNVDDHLVGGSFLKVPAMELESPDDDSHIEAANLMPDIGASYFSSASGISKVTPSGQNDLASSNASSNNIANSTASKGSDGKGKPVMAASVLHLMAAEHQADKKSPEKENHLQNATFAATGAKHGMTNNNSAHSLSICSEASTKLEMAAALNISRPISFTRSSVHHAPAAMLKSLFSSFSTLVESRVRTWTLLLLRHSLSSGDQTSRDRLMALLSTQQSFNMEAMITHFEPKPLTHETAMELKKNGRIRNQLKNVACSQGKSGFGLEFCDFIIPIEFQAAIDIGIQGQQITVHLRAPAQIGAIFSEDSSKITYGECKVDANVLVSSMVEQARLVVFQAVAGATSSSEEVMERLRPKLEKMKTSDEPDLSTKKRSAGQVVGGLPSRSGSAIREDSEETQPANAPRPAFSPTEAGTTGPTLKPTMSASLLRKPGSFMQKKMTTSRSVQWNNTFTEKTIYNASPGNKRMRTPTFTGQTMKRSTKSFGKPNAEIFESSRNATFAEFGNIGVSPHVAKMSKNNNGLNNTGTYHVSTHLLRRNKTPSEMTNSDKSKTNSQFELSRPRNGVSSNSFDSTSTPPLTNDLKSKKPSFQELSRTAVYSIPPPNVGSNLFGSVQTSNTMFHRTPTMLESVLLSTQTKSETSVSNDDVSFSRGNATFDS